MTKKYAFITQFNRSCEDIRDIGCVKFTKPSQVKESLSYAVDINTIYDNYCKTGKLPLNGNQPIYDENFISYDNLIEAQQAVKEASLYFQTLPSEIRSQYGNDLGAFVKAIHSNDQFLIDKGVLKKTEVKEPVVSEPVGDLDTPVQPTVPAAPNKPASGSDTTVSGSSTESLAQ